MTRPTTQRQWFLSTGMLMFLLRARSAEAHIAVADSALFSGILQPGVHAEGLFLVAALGLLSGVSLRDYQGDMRLLLCFYGVGFGVGVVAPIVGESLLAAGSLVAVIVLCLAVALDRPWGVRLIMMVLAIGGWTVAMFGREGLAMGFPGSLFFCGRP
ncbi:MAG: hypothetical protein K8I00_13410, partial [Candidatus Omnitrophica bacterium]|nr:hypothetical protein [Candidatus Omnitrophota bacterium]